MQSRRKTPNLLPGTTKVSLHTSQNILRNTIFTPFPSVTYKHYKLKRRKKEFLMKCICFPVFSQYFGLFPVEIRKHNHIFHIFSCSAILFTCILPFKEIVIMLTVIKTFLFFLFILSILITSFLFFCYLYSYLIISKAASS